MKKADTGEFIWKDESYDWWINKDSVTDIEDLGFSVRQGDGWVEGSVDCDCYHRAELADTQGRTVRSVAIAAGDMAVSVDTDGLPSGVYFFSLVADNGRKVTKKVLLK